MISEILARPRLFSEHDEKTLDLINLLASIIRRGQKAGEFRRRSDPTVAALTGCAAFFALVYAWVRQDGKIDIERAVAETLDIILNGISDSKTRSAHAIALIGKTRN